MKKYFSLFAFIIVLALSEINAKPEINVNFGFFYSSLRSYGEWIEIDRDLYAWRPAYVSHLWKPYTRGRWIWTSYGWYWDSYEPFGWAVYHYGRWYFDDYYGWIWIPDYDWGPAWVEWRYSDDYIGWAPLPPYASFHVSFGIRFSIGWSSSYYWWNFVPYRRFCDHRIDYYLIDNHRVERIFGKTKYRNNYYFDRDRIINAGIDRDFIERKAGYRIAEREVRTVNDRNEFEKFRREKNDRVLVYKPTERDFERNEIDRTEIKRAERTTTLEKDKITTPTISRSENKDKIERTRNQNEDINLRERESVRSNKENSERRNYGYPTQTEPKKNNERNYDNREFSKPRNERENDRTYERRVEPRSERNIERPTYRTEGNTGRSENRGNVERNSSRESNRSSNRRR